MGGDYKVVVMFVVAVVGFCGVVVLVLVIVFRKMAFVIVVEVI